MFNGKCGKCKRIYYSQHADTILCSCWEYCPLCRKQMAPYTPDLAPKTYGETGKRDFSILRVCSNTAEHPNGAFFFSTQKPKIVELAEM